MQKLNGDFVWVCKNSMGILSGSAKTQWGFCPGLQKLNGDFVQVCKNSMGILSGSAKT